MPTPALHAINLEVRFLQIPQKAAVRERRLYFGTVPFPDIEVSNVLAIGGVEMRFAKRMSTCHKIEFLGGR